jgi:hypothetical protein
MKTLLSRQFDAHVGSLRVETLGFLCSHALKILDTMDLI